MIGILFIGLTFFNIFFISNAYTYKYRNHDEITNILRDIARKNPGKAYVYSIGKSLAGKDLWVLALSDTKPNEHVILRPEVKYVANIHGNEVVGKEIVLRLIDYMLANQTTDPDVDYIMKNMRVHFLPLMNPDGNAKAREGDCYDVWGRYNKANFDLNRNFPDMFQTNPDSVQPETRAIIDWLEKNSFILSASFHGGALVANYPYDNYANSDGFTSKKSTSNDEDVFKHLARTYSKNHLKMQSGCVNEQFVEGITNGAEWYPLRGGMQDVNYWRYGCIEITLEVSCCKYPPASQLESYWLDNKKSAIEFLKLGNTGIKGIVVFAHGKIAQNVSIKVDSREPFFKTNENGEFYRILLPGKYTVSVLSNCQVLQSKIVEVTSSNQPTVLNFVIPQYKYFQYRMNPSSKNAEFCSQKLKKENINKRMPY